MIWQAWTIRCGKLVDTPDAAVVAECQQGRMLMYALHDYDPERDGDEEAWARELAQQGWRTWEPGAGPWITLGRRRVRRWSLRRERTAGIHADRGNND